ncbi:tetratricopeptide repeat protein [Sorangium sp. So ce854]|uniref:tetratricopeptide repeat protein n=1 Tax=Sorangium sp. So ce854 TaxID=3133322 RepID=UPI003F614B90
MGSGASAAVCGRCNADNSPFNPRCARCGAPLSEEPEAPPGTALARSSSGGGVAPGSPPDPFASTVLFADRSAPAAPAPPGAEAPPDLRPGARLGRFEVIDGLGRGAMGVVVRARDPVLGREVAIKVLRPEALGRSGTAQARARLVREAQAMARIKHPNVVTVHEVVVEGAQVLVVMEHVAGRTLRAFCAEARRPTAELLAAFLQAGEGLAEVHSAGLVHRDFKPDNVLVGADGRVRVTDFGLVGLAGRADTSAEVSPAGAAAEASPAGAAAEASPAGAAAEVSPAATPAAAAARPAGPADPLTRAGSILGTPAYMAPEQHLGQPADARADQFAFCVSLWEALAGERPFDGETYDELRANVAAGRAREPPRGAIPAWIRRCLARGLSVDRDQRYPDMAALLAALRRDPAAARRRGLAAALGIALAGLAAIGLARLRPDGICEGGEARLAGVWDEATKGKVRAAFAGTGRPHAEDTYRRVEGALDGRARAWVAMYADSCEATRVRGEQSEGLLDLRTACLERRRQEMTALTALFARGPDPEVLDRSVQASLALPGLEGCADTRALTAAIPPPADAAARARVDALRGRLAEVRALAEAGKFAEALALARPIADEARATGYAPVEAEALLALGRAQRDAHDARGAEATLGEAARAASRARDDALAADAWTQLIYVIGYQDARHADALALRLAAEGAVERIEDVPAASARLSSTLALVLNEQGKHGEAAPLAERALAGLREALGPDHPEVAIAESRLGSVLVRLERFDDAERAYQGARSTQERVLGPEHPHVALTFNNLGRLFTAQGRNREALPFIERAVALQEKALGPDHPFLAASLNNLGNALIMLGETDRARSAHERALAIRERALGPDHPDVAATLNNVGAVLEMQRKLAEAAPHYARALAIRERALGPDHPGVALTLTNLASVLVGQKKYAEALPHLGRALAIHEKTVGPGSIGVASTLTGIAAAYNEMGEPAEALPRAERALAIYAAREKGVPPLELADARLHAARALWGAGRDRRRALDLAIQARDAYAAEEGEYAKNALAEANAWLAARGRAR